MNVNEHIPYRIARRCNLSKLGDIVAIPIALFALKTLTAQVKDEEITPVLPEDTNGFKVAREENIIKPFQIGEICLAGLPCTKTITGREGQQNLGGTPTGLGFGIDYEGIGVPIFPETAADFKPSNGTSDIAKLKDFKYKELEFDAWWLK
jgi:hypothetical protein